MRIVLELLFTVVLMFVARAILSSVMRGVAQAGANAFRQTVEEAERRRKQASQGGMPDQPAGVLHKDPVCGTFVPESTQYQSREGESVVYFCSDACRRSYVPVSH